MAKAKRPASRPARSKFAERITSADDRDFIELARKRFKQAETADEDQRARELEDLEFYAGKQWAQDVVNARAGQPGNATSGLPPVPARPTYVINKVREPVRQVLNQERQSDLGVEIAAADDFGEATPGVSPQEIELREGLVRRIQRESQAQDARSWAFARATIAGRGFYRVMTRYMPGKTNDQEIYVDRIYNQASVSLDPSHEQPDGSDAEWGFVGTDLPWDRYQADYGTIGKTPNPLVTASASEWRQLGDELPGWFTADGETRSVRIVEYWYTERTQKTLHTLADGSFAFDDELTDEDEPTDSRAIVDKQIKWAKLDGVQVLEETDWDGHYIPIVKVIGEELLPYDSQRRAEGMVRPARDSQRGFNVMVSKWVEQIGLAPIPPWMGAAGFDEGFENEYALANTRTLSALHFNTKDSFGNPIAAPTRTSITMEIQAIAGSVQLFDQAIKSTTAIPDVTLGNTDPNIRSAKAQKQVLDQATQGTSHFLDNLARSIRYEGLIVNDLLYPIYGRKGRIVRMMNPRGETQGVMLHQPFLRHPQTNQPVAAPPQMLGQPPQPGQPQPQTYTLTPDATFNITVKVTKNYDTRREAQESVLSSLVQADPQQMAIVGDLLFKYNDGPGHEELEQRYKAVLNPQVQAAISGQHGPDPQLQQAMAENAQLKQVIQSKQAEVQAQGQITIQKAQIDAQSKLQQSQMEIAAKERLEWIQVSAQVAIAGAKLDVESARTFVDAVEARAGKALDLHLQQVDHVAAAATQGRDHAQQILQSTLDHAQTLQQADQGQAHALQQGQQGHAQALEQTAQQGDQALAQQQQAAALQPEPTADSTGTP